jgi:hypothetical protein
VREESHLDDMRSAIRGDFDRLAERRGVQELMQVSDEQSKLGDAAAPESGTVTEGDCHRPLDSNPDATTMPEPEPEPEPDPEGRAEADVEALASEDRPRSWLDRFLGR